MSGGSRTRAYELAIKLVQRYGYDTLSVEDFDDACAEINDGIEVEWDKE